MANGLLSMFGNQAMPGQKSPMQGRGLLGIDPMTWFQIAGALGSGAEQNSWGVGLGGVGNVLQNRSLMQQQEEDRRAEQGYRGWQMKQAERAAEYERRQAELMQGYRDRTLALEQQDYELRRRKAEYDMANPTTRTPDRPITDAERATWGLEADTPYAISGQTGRPMPIAGTRAQEWTMDQSKVAGYANRMIAANSEIQSLTGAGFNPAAVRSIPGMRSQEGRQYDRAVREFASAVLRRETGATITPQELDDVQARYFPAFGDDAATMAAKAAARDRIVQDYILESSGAYEARYGSYAPPAASPTQASSPTAPAVGTQEDGYEYVGGDPADPASWRRVSG